MVRALLLALVVRLPVAVADEQMERRVLMGIQLFPAVLAADEALAAKRDGDGTLHLVLLYRQDRLFADEAAGRLGAAGAIRGFPLRVETLTYARLAELDAPPAALALVEWSPTDLAAVVSYGIEHSRMVFSPFKGDVAKGALAGIFIGDRILPLLNLQTLEASGITLKPFLLEVARTHE